MAKPVLMMKDNIDLIDDIAEYYKKTDGNALLPCIVINDDDSYSCITDVLDSGDGVIVTACYFSADDNFDQKELCRMLQEHGHVSPKVRANVFGRTDLDYSDFVWALTKANVTWAGFADYFGTFVVCWDYQP